MSKTIFCNWIEALNFFFLTNHLESRPIDASQIRHIAPYYDRWEHTVRPSRLLRACKHTDYEQQHKYFWNTHFPVTLSGNSLFHSVDNVHSLSLRTLSAMTGPTAAGAPPMPLHSDLSHPSSTDSEEWIQPQKSLSAVLKPTMFNIFFNSSLDLGRIMENTSVGILYSSLHSAM